MTFSTAGLQSALSDGDGVVEVIASAMGIRQDGPWTRIVLEGGRTVASRVVVDASGSRRTLTGGPPPGRRAAQTAVGVVVDNSAELTGVMGEAVFMDWRQDHGHDGWPTFLYAVPLGEGKLLLEETSLARRPGLSQTELHRRLINRLAARGVDVPGDAPIERVAFVVDTPLTRGVGAIVAYGAAAPLIHPATGYSVAVALQLADQVVDAVDSGLPSGRAAAAAAREVIWPPGARLVHRLRQRGLESLLGLPPAGVIDFFELFFGLPEVHQRTYLSDRSNPMAVAAAMWEVFSRADGGLKRHLFRSGRPDADF